MQKQKCSLDLYSRFIIASQNRYTATELSRVAPEENVHHDAITNWLASARFDPKEIWNQVKDLVEPSHGYLVVDDTVLDKRYSETNDLIKLQYSGNEHGLIKGIGVVNLLWTDHEKFIPVDYRQYHPKIDEKDKNDLFQEMVKKAVKRGFSPHAVLFDSWYASVKNIKFIRGLEWRFICNLKSNRLVSEQKGTYVPIQDLNLANKQVRQVWLKEFGTILVCKLVARNGDITYLATNDLSLTKYDEFTRHFAHRWKIETFHRGLKQTTGIEKCQATTISSQKTHIFAAFVAFMKLERTRLKDQTSWYEQKAQIHRMTVASYLYCSNP